MSERSLTPLEIVEVGRRLSENRVSGLGLTRLVEDARLVVRTTLDALASEAAHLGVERDELVPWALQGRTIIRHWPKRRKDELVEWADSVAHGLSSLIRFGRRRSTADSALSEWLSYADTDDLVARWQRGNPLPPPRTVLHAESRDRMDRTAFVLDKRQVLLFGDLHPRNVYVSWDALNSAANVVTKNPSERSWKRGIQYEEGQGLALD